MKLAIRKVGCGWQVYDLGSAWTSAALWASYDLAVRERRLLARAI